MDITKPTGAFLHPLPERQDYMKTDVFSVEMKSKVPGQPLHWE
jgi:hypothetical protein